MITKSVIIEPNAVTVVETALKLTKTNKPLDNFFIKPYLEKLYNFNKYCLESKKQQWIKEIDKTLSSISTVPKKDVINKLDLLESTGEIMKAIDEHKTKEEINEFLKELGVYGERLVSVLCYMLIYSKYGIEFYKEYISKDASLENELLNSLYVNARLDRAKANDERIKGERNV